MVKGYGSGLLPRTVGSTLNFQLLENIYSQRPGRRRTHTNTPSKQTLVFDELLCCTVKISNSVHPFVPEDEDK